MGTKIVSMEKRNYGDPKLTLDGAIVVMLRSDGPCCAFADITIISEIKFACDHAITHVKATKAPESYFSEALVIGKSNQSERG